MKLSFQHKHTNFPKMRCERMVVLDGKIKCDAAVCSQYSPPCDEVRQSNDEGANGHQHTTNCNDLRPMEFGSKVTDKSNHQQVSWEKA